MEKSLKVIYVPSEAQLFLDIFETWTLKFRNFDVGGGNGVVWTPNPLVIFHVFYSQK